ncbi:MAG: (2Fe-2S) ferredoxin domain-containing protein [Planctomycetota bacterium]
MARLQRTIFVCTRSREAGSKKACCGARGGEAVLEALKVATAERGMKRVFRATSSGCLDQCDLGVTVVVYPDDVWYGGVTVEDVPELVDRHILGGEVVERLRIPDDKMTGVAREVTLLPELREPAEGR